LAELQTAVAEGEESGEAPANPTLERMWQLPSAGGSPGCSVELEKSVGCCDDSKRIVRD
jgi:hypothetical protein